MSAPIVDSILGYFVLKFGFLHALVSYVWAMLPFIIWSWDKYVFWWPFPYLNLHVLCMMYCCLTEVGLTIVYYVLSFELHLLLLVTYSFRNDLGREIEEQADTRATWEALFARFREPLSIGELPPWVPYGVHRFYFLLWAKVLKCPEIEDRDRQRKYRLLAMVYAIPTNFFAICEIRVCGWFSAYVMSFVLYGIPDWMWFCMCCFFSASQDNEKNDLHDYYEDVESYT
jgi:hypothetical protein